MLSSILPLAEIDFFTGDTPDTLRYVYCDFCHKAVYHDLLTGTTERVFYEVLGEDGLVVCGNCVSALE